MARFSVDPELLEAKANEIRGYKVIHDENVQKISNLVHGITEIWQGNAQQAYVEKFENIKQHMHQFSELLEGFAKLMESNARTYRETEENLKNANQH